MPSRIRENLFAEDFGPRIPLFRGICLVALAGMFLVSFLEAAAEAREANSRFPHELNDPRELEAFLDGVIGGHMCSFGTPGVGVVVVKEGKIFFSKGYGFAEQETGRPVIPDRTVFPLFSTTKAFTATAIMAMVEKGRLDLQADVRHYDPRLPSFGGLSGPLTLHQILTHSTGLDKNLEGLAWFGPMGAPPPFLSYLTAHQPERTDTPGAFCMYDLGYAYTIAGDVLETVSGKSYPDLMKELILEPLEMSRSDFRITASQEADLALGYIPDFSGGPFRRCGRLTTQVAPASVLHATVEDVGHFLIAHLEGGLYGTNRLLASGTIERMHASQFRSHPTFPGVGYGFFRGPGYVECLGGPFPHLGGMILVPHSRIGLFFASNAPTGLELLRSLKYRFLERYFPRTVEWEPGPPETGTPAPVADFEGLFRIRFASRRGIDKLELLAPIAFEMRIRPDGPDRLEIEHTMIPLRWSLVRTGTDLFHRTDSMGPIAFQRDQGGKVTGFVTHPFLPFIAMPFSFERISWWESRLPNLCFLGMFFLFFFWQGFIRPLVMGLARLRGGTAGPEGQGWHRRGIACLAFLNLVVLGMPLWASFPTIDIIPRFIFGMPPAVAFLMRAGVLVAGLDILAPLLALHFSWRSSAGRLDKVLFGISALVSAAFAPFSLYWNLITL